MNDRTFAHAEMSILPGGVITGVAYDRALASPAVQAPLFLMTDLCDSARPCIV